MDGNADINYQVRILEQGVFVGFDRFGIQRSVGAPLENDCICTLNGLIGLGCADQLMIFISELKQPVRSDIQDFFFENQSYCPIYQLSSVMEIYIKNYSGGIFNESDCFKR